MALDGQPDPEPSPVPGLAGQRHLLYCGRYSAQKGLPELLDFARRYAERHPDRFAFIFIGQGEVAIPAYEALRQNPAQANQMLEALLRGISTREYKDVLPEMAEAVGVSRSSVSRQAIEASEKQLSVLRERRWDQVRGPTTTIAYPCAAPRQFSIHAATAKVVASWCSNPTT